MQKLTFEKYLGFDFTTKPCKNSLVFISNLVPHVAINLDFVFPMIINLDDELLQSHFVCVRKFHFLSVPD